MTFPCHDPDDERLDQQIRRALAELPRERAGQGFTDRVLRRLDAAPISRRDSFRPHPWLAAAALAALALAIVLVASGAFRPSARSAAIETAAGGSDTPALASAGDDRPDRLEGAPTPTETVRPTSGSQEVPSRAANRREVAAALDELRREHLRLERNLRDLRELAEGSRVIYVGGDEDLDLVLRLGSEPTGDGGARIQPARLSGSRPGGGPRSF